MRLRDGLEVGPPRSFPVLLELSRVPAHETAPGWRARVRWPRRSAGHDLPHGRRGHGPEDGPLRPVPGLLAVSRVQGDAAPGAGRRRQALQVEVLAPIEEKCPECGRDLMWRRGRFGAFVACSDYPTCKHVKKKETREVGLSAPSATRRRSSSARGDGDDPSTAAGATPSAGSPLTTGRYPSPAPSAPARTSWRRRPRRKARSSSAATRPALQAPGGLRPRPIPAGAILKP